MTRKLLALLLALTLLLSLIPVTALAETTDASIQTEYISDTTVYTIDFDFIIDKAGQGFCFGMKDTGTFVMWQVNANNNASTDKTVILRPHFKSNGGWTAYPGGPGNLQAVDLTAAIGYNTDEILGKTVHERIEVNGTSIKTYFGKDENSLTLAYDYTHSEEIPLYNLGFRHDNSMATNIPETSYYDNIVVRDADGNVLYSNDFSYNVTLEGTDCYYQENGMLCFYANYEQVGMLQPNTPVARVGEVGYDTVTEAVAAANGETVTILANTGEAIAVSKNVTIDLAGHTLSDVTVADDATLTLIDSATADFEGEYGCATVSGTVAGGENYLLVSENGSYSAHCYDVAITHISLSPSKDALGYKAQLFGDEAVQSRVESIGFNMWVDGGKVRTYSKTEAGVVTLRLKNILANKGGEMNINATAFVSFGGDVKTSQQQTTTMQKTLQTVDAAWKSYTRAQKKAVKALCDLYYDTVSAWELNNIYGAEETVDNTTDQYTIDFDFNIVSDNLGLCFNMQDSGSFIMWQVSTYDGAATDTILLRPHFKSGGEWKGYPGQEGYDVTAVDLTQLLGITASELKARTEPVHGRIVVSGNNIKSYFGLNGETDSTPAESLTLVYDFTYSAATSLPFYSLGFRQVNNGTGLMQEIAKVDNLIARCNTTGDVLYSNDFSNVDPEFIAGNGMSFVTEDGMLQVGSTENVSEQIYMLAADTVTLDIPEGQQAVYRCEAEFDGTNAITVTLGGTTMLTIASGNYSAGTYEIELLINPAQEMATVNLTMPDGSTYTRGLYQAANGKLLIVYSANWSAVTSSQVTYEDVNVRTYELTTEEPENTGFEANVYYHTTSFVDARTTRAFAWAADAAWLDNSDMALLYRAAGADQWIEAEVVRESDRDPDQEFFKCDISGLTPGTAYEYKFGKQGSTDDWSVVRTFTTAQAEDSGEFTFLAVGDTQSITWNGLTSNDKGAMFGMAAYEAAFEAVNDPAFMIHTGDVVEYGSNVDHWNWFFKSYGEKGANTPLFTTLGGHDSWPTADNNVFYYGHVFNNPDNGGAAAYNSEILDAQTSSYARRLINCLDESVYSFNYENLHIVVLNTGDAHQNDAWLTVAQREWLIADLEANRDAQWTMVLAHESPFSTAGLPTDVFDAYGVDLVVSGHTHYVSRSFPMRSGVPTTKTAGNNIQQGSGTVYTIIGATALNHDAAPALNLNTDTDRAKNHALIASPAAHQPTYSVFKVSKEALTVTISQVNGLVLDEFTIHATENGGSPSKQVLLDTIAAAQEAAENVTVGDLAAAEVKYGTKFVSTETMNALNAAIAEAETAYVAAFTEEAITAAAAALQTAVDTFNAAVQVGQATVLTISTNTDAVMDVTVTVNGTETTVTLPTTVSVSEGDTVSLSAALRNDVEYVISGCSLNGESISDTGNATFTASGAMDLSVDVDWIGYTNLAQYGTVTSPNGYANSSWKLTGLTNGSVAANQGWSSTYIGMTTTPSSPVTVTVDMKTTTKVDRFHIYARTNLACAPEDFTISVSTDGSTYTPVATVTGAEYKVNCPFVVQLDAPVDARYITVSVTEVTTTDSGGNGYVQMMEFGAYCTKAAETQKTPVEIKFETEAEQARITSTNNTTVTFDNGDAILSANATLSFSSWHGYASDPWAWLDLTDLSVLAQEYPYVVMVYKTDKIAASNTPNGGFHVGAGNTTSAVGASFTGYSIVDDGKWNSVIVDLSDNAYWIGTPNFFRMDFLQQAMQDDGLRLKGLWLVSTEEQAKEVAQQKTAAANAQEDDLPTVLNISTDSDAPMTVTVTVNGTKQTVTLPTTVDVAAGDTVAVSAVLLNDVEYAIAGWSLNGESFSNTGDVTLIAYGAMDLSLNVDWIGYTNLAQYGTVTSPNGYANNSWKLAGLTDGSIAANTGWSSTTIGKTTTPATPVTVTIDMKATTMVDRFHIYPRTNLTLAPVDFVISVSTDGSTFTPVATVTGATHKTKCPYPVQLDAPVEARYIMMSVSRISATDSYGVGYVQMMEFGAYCTKAAQMQKTPVEIKFETEAEQARITSTNNTTVTFDNGDAILSADATLSSSDYASDPWAWLNLTDLSVLAQEYPYVVMVYQTDKIAASDTPNGGFHVGAGKTTSTVGASFATYSIVDDGNWNSVILDLSDNAYWIGTPNFFRIDFLQEAMQDDGLRLKGLWLVSTREEAQAIADELTETYNNEETAQQ